MKTLYESFGKLWEWDTKTLRWHCLGNKPEEKHLDLTCEMKKSPVEYKTWKAWLYDTFKTSRGKPGWETLKNLHDEEDRLFFYLLENLYKMGKLKLEV